MKHMLKVNEDNISNIYIMPCLLLSILLKDEKYWPWYFSEFFMLCAGVYEKGGLVYHDGYVKVFYFATDLNVLNSFFQVTRKKTGNPDEIITEIIKQLQDGSHIILDLDEFYVKDTYYYNRVHYYRKFLVYGYDTKENIFYAKTQDKFTVLRTFHLSFSALYAMLERHNGTKDRVNFDGYVVYAYKRKPYTGNQMRGVKEIYEKQFERYFRCNSRRVVNCREDITYYYGFGVYDSVAEAFRARLENIEKIDYRALAVMADHKKKVAERLQYFQNQTGAAGLFKEEITRYTKMEHRLLEAMKSILHPYGFDMNRKAAIFNRLIEILHEVKAEEYTVATSVYEKLKNA